MARNHEKAKSMLHRFRDAQAAELGFSVGATRRPRVTSSVTSLREAEKWRGEVLRDISRKVSKIQDFNLTDYEVRDLNDEINKLIREKTAWEYQIISLGGANYRRGVPKMLDDSGREVPGTHGYKYFGRAKDLPGVKELLFKSAEEEEEAETYRTQKYKRFMSQPAAYYGDEDEDDGTLLESESAAELEAWRQGYAQILEDIEGEIDPSKIPPIPRSKPTNLKEIASQSQAQMDIDGDHKAAGDAARVSAMLNVLDPEQLKPPAVPDRSRMESFLLQARKKALREQCECRAAFGRKPVLTTRSPTRCGSISFLCIVFIHSSMYIMQT